MTRITIESVDEKALDDALDAALRQTVTDVARDRDLHDTRGTPWVVSDRCISYAERMLGLDATMGEGFDEDGTEWLRRVVWHDLYDSGRWTDEEARRLLIDEYREMMRGARDSGRWREIVDMLWDFRYFDNVRVTDVLSNRDYGHWTSDSIRNHGITVGWDLVLVNGWGRLGADPEWNKASDALMLLYWPGVDEMGKRRWKAVRDKLADALDPRSEGHRRLIKDKRGARDEFRIDMDPRHGADA